MTDPAIELTAVRQSGSNGARRSGARTGIAVALVTFCPPNLAAGKTEPPHLLRDSAVGRLDSRRGAYEHSRPTQRAEPGETAPPGASRLIADLPDNWRELDSYASWLEACAEMRRKAGGK
jgi:hypothetical protein